jgi:hypothetical protein
MNQPELDSLIDTRHRGAQGAAIQAANHPVGVGTIGIANDHDSGLENHQG